jgi:hypothetical protein
LLLHLARGLELDAQLIPCPPGLPSALAQHDEQGKRREEERQVKRGKTELPDCLEQK